MNRLTYEGQVAGPRHKVSLDAALKAITIDAAHSIQQENKVGSIEVGKDANLTVLEQIPYDVPPARLNPSVFAACAFSRPNIVSSSLARSAVSREPL